MSERPASKLMRKVDWAILENQEDGNRRHLGASIIGRTCGRQLWYIFRWAKRAPLTARVIRLFDRGHKEEDRFIYYLKQAGVTVHSHSSDGKQYKITYHNGHFGGSLDSVFEGVPDIPEGQPCLGEYKTHGEKSFKEIDKNGLKKAKFEHYVQMQVYMYAYKLKYGVYLAVNKNDDDWFTRVIELDEKLAVHYINRGGMIINAKGDLPKIGDSTWYECRFCTFANICHKDEPAEINCRTCYYSTPVKDKKWHCQLHNYEIPQFLAESGCDQHIYLPDMINAEAVHNPKTDEVELRQNYTNEVIDVSVENSKQYYDRKTFTNLKEN